MTRAKLANCNVRRGPTRTVRDSLLPLLDLSGRTNLETNSTHTSLPPTPSAQHQQSSIHSSPASRSPAPSGPSPVQRQSRPNPRLKAIISLAPPASLSLRSALSLSPSRLRLSSSSPKLHPRTRSPSHGRLRQSLDESLVRSLVSVYI